MLMAKRWMYFWICSAKFEGLKLDKAPAHSVGRYVAETKRMQTMKVPPIQRFIRWFGGSESGLPRSTVLPVFEIEDVAGSKF